ncbi:hypothetical protein [Rahnella sikkimica]|uniref:Uncharacterized protein n=1 Tax=Rahnella sikkimica TaxID=1805933 RepID=A0A2L1UWS8_9GAMM|nr:hypothetical protein [Rahnella sikkimica]AVF37367.1 hypothetical protein BV494_05430 [Rahnella sikkimica]
MRKLTKWICVMFVMFFLFFAWIIISFGYAFDGREYKKSDWFDYYYLTPSLIRNAPAASENATYHVRGGDEHQNFEEEVVWSGVKDVPRAVKELDAYLINEGIDVETEYKQGAEYFVLHYNDVVVLKISDCMGPCNRF